MKVMPCEKVGNTKEEYLRSSDSECTRRVTCLTRGSQTGSRGPWQHRLGAVMRHLRDHPEVAFGAENLVRGYRLLGGTTQGPGITMWNTSGPIEVRGPSLCLHSTPVGVTT